ncbi:MAG: cadherin-like beta sandwich domain-containing protein [Bacilli bacterium]|nr:cadherin-like beta sandwich domain-containing protein [Bacilli bacterium]MDD4407171.1 cadherin-like beta sandwich domain-containing protein [Bacilli bacterium]
MKKTSKKILFMIIMVGIILFPLYKVNAANNFTINIQSNKSSIIIGEEVTINVAIQNINDVSGGLTGCVSTLNMNDNNKLSYVSVTGLNGWTATYAAKLALDTDSSHPILSNTNVASLKFKGLVAGSVTIIPTADDCNNGVDEFTGNSNSLTINVKNPPSNNANLTSLSLANGTISPSFNSSTVNYTATINAASTIINAGATSGATISGNGTKYLNYGNNSFSVTVTAEDGITKKVYNVNIVRPDTRSVNNKLSAISISTGSINFNPSINSYSITIPSEISSFSILNATAQDSKSKISYNNKTVSLNYGETKAINIIVTSESGVNNTYTINVTRTDGRSNNNYLSSLNITGISLVFNKNTLNYNAVVENSVSSVNITAGAEDLKSSVTGIGTKILNVGSNSFQVKVISEKGSEKIYTIVLIKKDENNQIPGLSDNAFLKSLKINDQDFKFDKNIYKYTIYLESTYDKAVIIAEKEDEKSIIALNGNEVLEFGVNNFEITVTAENANVKKYAITIIRKNNLIEEKLLNNSKSLVISNNTFKNAEKGYQDLRFIINNSENKELYRWDFKLENLKNTNISPKLDIEINNSSYKEEILKITKSNPITNLTFKHEGLLPGKSTVTINLANIYKDGNIVNLYYYDKNNKTIKLIKKNISIVNGNVTFDINHCSEYFLTNNIIQDIEVNDSQSGEIIVYIIIAILILTTLGLFIYIKKKNVKETV